MYLIDKLSRKNIYLRKILDLDYEYELRYILLLDLDLKSCGQRFIIIGVGLALDLKILGLQMWITIIIFYGILSLKNLDYGFGF